MKELFLFLLVMPFSMATADSGGCVIFGSAKAPLTIEEYGDFVCPHCGQAVAMMDRIEKDYRGKVRLVFRNLPRANSGLVAVLAARAFAAICLQNPALARPFYNELFKNQEKLFKESSFFLTDAAKKVNADVPRMKADMNGPAVAAILADDQKRADENKLGGTPSFLVGSQAVVGLYPYSHFRRYIDQKLSRHRERQ